MQSKLCNLEPSELGKPSVESCQGMLRDLGKIEAIGSLDCRNSWERGRDSTTNEEQTKCLGERQSLYKVKLSSPLLFLLPLNHKKQMVVLFLKQNLKDEKKSKNISNLKQFIRFSGNINGCSATTFLRELERQLQFSGIESWDYLNFVEYLLDGFAKVWFHGVKNSIKDFDEFSVMLRNHFQSRERVTQRLFLLRNEKYNSSIFPSVASFVMSLNQQY